MQVESFKLDHTMVDAPYVRLCGIVEGKHGDKACKYDIRFKQPNSSFIEIKALHSLEHLLAENIREYMNDVIDISPMGCQTGFYLIMFNNESVETVIEGLKKTLENIIKATKIPADNDVQCGRAISHDLYCAKKEAKKMLNAYKDWSTVFKKQGIYFN